MKPYFSIKYSAGAFLAILFLLMVGCDPGDPIDPAPPPPPPPPPSPPPPTRVDTLLGAYSGNCFSKEAFLDYMTGQPAYIRDTFSREIRLISIDTLSNGYYKCVFDNYGFFEYVASPDEFNKDTIQFSNYWGIYNDRMSIVPGLGLILTNATTYNPNGFGYTISYCEFQKSL